MDGYLKTMKTQKLLLLGNILDTIESNRTLGENAKKCIVTCIKV